MIAYAVEKLEDCLEEMKPILLDHYKEVAMYKDKIAFNPDYDRYFTLEKAGMLNIVTAREDGELIGYFISMLVPHIHYADHKYALNDILFIKESHRGSGFAVDMFKYAEQQLKALGVSVIIIHMKTALPFDTLCTGLGYDYAERNYSKYIGE